MWQKINLTISLAGKPPKYVGIAREKYSISNSAPPKSIAQQIVSASQILLEFAVNTGIIKPEDVEEQAKLAAGYISRIKMEK